MKKRYLPGLLILSVLAACGGGSTTPEGRPQSVAESLAPLSLAERTYENGELVSRDESDVPAQVFRLYKAAFNRESDSGGLGYHVAHIESIGLQLTDIAGNFVASPEFAQRYGALSNEAFVRQLYLNVLGREPDPGGLAFHVANLVNGLSRGQTLVGFSESPENKTNTAAAVAAGVRYTPWQPPATPVDPAVGEIASADIVKIPAGAGFADSFVATNTGLYMRLFDMTGNATGLMKLRGNPIFNDWYTIGVSLDGGELVTWVPANIRTETAAEASVYYVTSKDDPSDPTRSIGTFVYSTANSGGPGYTETDDRGILSVAAGSGSAAGITAFRPWVRTAFGLYADGGQYSGARTTSDRFRSAIPDPDGRLDPFTGRIANLDLPSDAVMSAHPTTGHLFVGAGNTLYEISPTKVEARTQLPVSSDALATITNMAWANGELFFAYGGQVWRRSTSGQVAAFANVDANTSFFGAQEGLFCIQGGEVLMRGGTAKSIFWGTERPWLIRPGPLPQDQLLKSVYLQVLSGVYCTPEGNGVYGIAGQDVVFIRPLVR